MMRRATILRTAIILRTAMCAAAAFTWMSATALAQQGVPNALQGFSQNKDKPVKIEAASLEVRDKDKVATFSGDVNVTQGDTNMRCKSLLVFYDQDSKAASGGMKAAKPGPGGQSAIKRLEARGGVIVTQKEQTATGETGIFDMKSNTITLSGKVTVTQGQNVLRGDRLVVDIATGAARVESGGGRVEGLFVPSGSGDSKLGIGKDKDKDKEKKGKDKEKDKEAAPAASAPAASAPAVPAASAPAAPAASAPTAPAALTRPATRDAGAAPERTKPVAPRGIY